ncbi:GntR family transcriptional regulator [Tissierella carlieri]|uniref:GntR family transcriptional regulator n=1 Tax=Tissierella carlieri TaxID=689904 RepID=A0ABT1SG30_9FIRM|nr:GntR family transcriptional regulator [Tissierella carlieri]MCQ4925435.1 GntR family transcriptional regulator [Tissierella carlieri]
MNNNIIATSDEVTEKLRDAIISGEFVPCQRLIEDTLAMKFETSRTPIREAIRKLASVGLVKIEPYKGAIVADVNADEIREIYAVRASLEGLAVKLATPNISKEVIDDLENMIKEMEKSVEQKDRKDFEKWNVEFHLTIYTYCQNKILFNLIRDLLDRTVLFRRSSWESERNLRTVIKSHREILSAIIKGDAEKAKNITEDHTRLYITD